MVVVQQWNGQNSEWNVGGAAEERISSVDRNRGGEWNQNNNRTRPLQVGSMVVPPSK